MKLIELNPLFKDDELSMDCPKCRQHRITIPVKPKEHGWDREGDGSDFYNLTIYPSIAHDNGVGCQSHFFVTKGEIQMV